MPQAVYGVTHKMASGGPPSTWSSSVISQNRVRDMAALMVASQSATLQSNKPTSSGPRISTRRSWAPRPGQSGCRSDGARPCDDLATCSRAFKRHILRWFGLWNSLHAHSSFTSALAVLCSIHSEKLARAQCSRRCSQSSVHGNRMRGIGDCQCREYERPLALLTGPSNNSSGQGRSRAATSTQLKCHLDSAFHVPSSHPLAVGVRLRAKFAAF